MPTEPNPLHFQPAKHYVWRCWWESCRLCETMEGKVYTWDTWYNAGIMPGFHAYCDCTLKEVADDVPLSDPAFFHYDLNSFLRRGEFRMFEQMLNQRSWPLDIMDTILAATPEGGTIQDAFTNLSLWTSGKAGFWQPISNTKGGKWFLQGWEHIDDVFPWVVTNTLAYFQGISGFGGSASLKPQVQHFRPQTPSKTYNRYIDTYLRNMGY